MLLSEARKKATIIAQQIIAHRVQPYERAMKIWKEILNNLETKILNDLWPFKSNARAIEDCLWNQQETGNDHSELIKQCEKEILAAARSIVQSD